MSSVKRLFHVRKFRTIVALASVFGIIFLSWMIIDKDNSIAQPPMDYVATAYIKIDASGITTMSGLKTNRADQKNICAALDKMRGAGKDFTLIEIDAGGRTQLIIARDVCVCEDAEPAVNKSKPPKSRASTALNVFRAYVLGENVRDVESDRKHAWVGYQHNPEVCRWWNGIYV